MMNIRRLSAVLPLCIVYSAQADFIWNGNGSITQDAWQNRDNWTVTGTSTFPTGGTGPGTPNSNAWDLIQIANATGTINTLEGWELKLNLQENVNLTVDTVTKFQSNDSCRITIATGSTLTISNARNSNRYHPSLILNNQGTLNIAYSYNQANNADFTAFQMDLGATGIVNITSQNNSAHTASITSLTATLTADGGTIDTTVTAADGTEIRTRKLVTLGQNMSIMQPGGAGTYTIQNGLDGVDALTDLGTNGDLSNAAVGSYKITNNTDGITISYVVAKKPEPDPDQPDPGEPEQPTDPDTPVDPGDPDEPDASQPILPPDPSDNDLLEAGSTIPTLNMAQHRAFYNRMFQMRDRGVRLGLDQEHTHTDLPYYHLWITGTGSYTDLNMQADYAGYTLSTWGGSAGADFNVNEHWSLGVALAADYGKLKATAYDEHAEADLDTYSLHFYTRYQQARWGHLFLIGGALSRATVERTMYIANDHWNTNGKTNGFGIGAMYELTYDVALNDERSAILQPLFNLSFATTQFDAYLERLQGTNATVDLHKQTHTTGTAAVGVRYLAQTGTNLFGRAVIAELRANVAQDFGDRQARVNGELAGESFTVRGAKVGMTALQAGAGITLPVGLQNAVFLHVNGDVRSKQYSVSGTLGWRYSF